MIFDQYITDVEECITWVHPRVYPLGKWPSSTLTLSQQATLNYITTKKIQPAFHEELQKDWIAFFIVLYVQQLVCTPNTGSTFRAIEWLHCLYPSCDTECLLKNIFWDDAISVLDLLRKTPPDPKTKDYTEFINARKKVIQYRSRLSSIADQKYHHIHMHNELHTSISHLNNNQKQLTNQYDLCQSKIDKNKTRIVLYTLERQLAYKKIPFATKLRHQLFGRPSIAFIDDLQSQKKRLQHEIERLTERQQQYIEQKIQLQYKKDQWHVLHKKVDQFDQIHQPYFKEAYLNQEKFDKLSEQSISSDPRLMVNDTFEELQEKLFLCAVQFLL